MSETTDAEPILEPDLPIVDAHHHLWFRPGALLDAIEQGGGLLAETLVPSFRRHARYLFDEFLADLETGHNVVATLYVEFDSMYRTEGPEPMRSVGEVEFANGMAAIAASGVLTDIRVCAGIVGSADLRLGDAVEEVLVAQMQAGGGRYRGIRGKHVAYDADPRVMGAAVGAPHVLTDPDFRKGFQYLGKHGLSYDAWQLEYQLPELIDLARAFPDTQIVVNHLGGLFGLGPYEGREQERFAAWRENIRALAECPGVVMKLGGLGMPTCGFPGSFRSTPPTSEELAEQWRPWIETCIEAFGASRCMFESNYPVDAATAAYPVIWNAFKRIVSGASAGEKAALFRDTAARVYGISL